MTQPKHLRTLIDIYELPYVTLKGLDCLPVNPGLYFVTSKTSLLYIGQSISLKTRWMKHHRLNQFCLLPDIRVRYLIISLEESSQLKIYERLYITIFKPTLNRCRLSSEISKERIRVDVWSSLKPVIEAEIGGTGLTANEVINMALCDYFGLSPSGNRQSSINIKSSPPKKTPLLNKDDEDYI
jgi:hypothetical protein